MTTGELENLKFRLNNCVDRLYKVREKFIANLRLAKAFSEDLKENNIQDDEIELFYSQIDYLVDDVYNEWFDEEGRRDGI